MPTPTYVALAKTVLTGNQTTVTFSGIVNTYTDLVVVASARTDVALVQDFIKVSFNSVTGAYSTIWLIGTGGGATVSSGQTNLANEIRWYYAATGANATSNTFANAELYIPNYAGSTNKPTSGTGVAETNASAVNMAATAGLMNNTAAITSITLAPWSGPNFVSGSRFDLYGIKNS